MKLLVFAHTPPPHHGQSYMVRLMLAGFGGDHRQPRSAGNAGQDYGISCYHVNARFSATMLDIGGFQVRKLALLLWYCLQAIWCRFRYGVKNLYYVPAPGVRAALYRDWMVMCFCRPFFKRVVFHWHAAGLADWLEASGSGFSRRLTRRLLGNADLSIVLSDYNRGDAQRLASQRIMTVGNGISDPCPEFETRVLPRRLARFAARKKLFSRGSLNSDDWENTGGDPHVLKFLFLAHCTREKGLFDALAAVVLLNRKLAEARLGLRAQLTVAGGFLNESEQVEFEKELAGPQFRLPKADAAGPEPAMSSVIQYLGFISGEEKLRVLTESDGFCFPTYYLAENLPVALIEAMAFGLPVVTTRWRSLPELFPADYQGLVGIRSPEEVAEAMHLLMSNHPGMELRELFLRGFTLDRHLSNLASALSTIESEIPRKRAHPDAAHVP